MHLPSSLHFLASWLGSRPAALNLLLVLRVAMAHFLPNTNQWCYLYLMYILRNRRDWLHCLLVGAQLGIRAISDSIWSHCQRRVPPSPMHRSRASFAFPNLRNRNRVPKNKITYLFLMLNVLNLKIEKK